MLQCFLRYVEEGLSGYMKRAIVLSGGGGKGAYQIGFWKAIRELDIKYDIITGTSIGALNGAFMVQGNYGDAVKLWYSMDYSKVIDGGMGGSFYAPKGRKKVILKYAKGAVKGGLSVPGLERIINDNLRPDLFYSSSIDYGLVTVKFPSLKPVMISKKEIPRDLLADYLLASASCFPAFKMKEINKESYIDGGYYDNMPMDLAVKLGAEEIIGVDLRAPGKKRKLKNANIPITMISSKNGIGNFLVLEKMQARRAMKLGYNDTMKTFEKLEGDYFTFKKGSLKRNYDRLNERFYSNLNCYIDKKTCKGKYKKMYTMEKETYFNYTLENIMKAFEFDDTLVYRSSYANALIKRKYKKEKEGTHSLLKKAIRSNKLNKAFIDKEMICYILEEINKEKPSVKIIDNLKTLFPDSFLCAIYIKTIVG